MWPKSLAMHERTLIMVYFLKELALINYIHIKPIIQVEIIMNISHLKDRLMNCRFIIGALTSLINCTKAKSYFFWSDNPKLN